MNYVSSVVIHCHASSRNIIPLPIHSSLHLTLMLYKLFLLTYLLLPSLPLSKWRRYCDIWCHAVTLCVCVCVCIHCISLGGEDNGVYPVLSSLILS